MRKFGLSNPNATQRGLQECLLHFDDVSPDLYAQERDLQVCPLQHDEVGPDMCAKGFAGLSVAF
jgi:hypothetical protein